MDQPPYDDPNPIDRAAAAAQVGPPAIALAIYAGISLPMGLLSLLFNLGMGAAMLASAGNLGGRSNPMMFAPGIFGAAAAVLQLALAATVLVGALKMRQLRKYGLSMAAAIIAMIPFGGCCCLLGLPFGIWALVMLLKPEVKAAFTS